MISIKNYEKPKSIEEAYELLKQNKKTTLIGGGAFLKLGSKQISTAIDLSEAGLNYIKESDDQITIGAMTTFHEVETNPIITSYCSGMLSESVKDIVGIQMRNMVTVGATVYSRYGFSDLITALLALNADVKLYKGGQMALEAFLENGSEESDILEEVILTKVNCIGAFKSIRKSRADYAVLNLGVTKTDKKIRISVGARPNRAILANKAMKHLEEKGIDSNSIEIASQLISDELVFGSNMRASAEYRESIAPVLFKRALEEVLNNED